MIELLSHDTNIWMVFSFIIFFLILVKAGKSAMVNVVDKRIETIKNDLQSAENLHVEAQELLAQYQRKHTNAVKEADEIIANAETYAAKIRKQAKKELRENLDRREAQLADRVERMKMAAISDIQKYAADIAIEATREIIIKEFDKKADKALTDDAIKSVSGQVH